MSDILTCGDDAKWAPGEVWKGGNGDGDGDGGGRGCGGVLRE